MLMSSTSDWTQPKKELVSLKLHEMIAKITIDVYKV